jgi:hypothetical protein
LELLSKKTFMITKEQYLGILGNEFRIIKHLAEKIKPEQLSHRPTEPQRNMQELMTYLTQIFISGVEGVVTGDGSAYKKYLGVGDQVKLENFAEVMDKQLVEVEKLITPLSEEDMASEVNMWGRNQSKALHLMGMLSIAAAYKMQLFLYMKQSGTENIGTMNLWAGMDQPPKVG